MTVQSDDPRLAPFERLRQMMPPPGPDAESRAERQLLHRASLKEQVRR